MSLQRTLNYYKELPEGYKEVYCINAKKTSVGVIMNLIAFAFALALIVGIFFIKFELPFELEVSLDTALVLFSLCLSLIAYMVIHELTHGLFYKILTKQKLKFGLTLTVAYCGLKEGYVNKKTALLAVLAPLVIHSIWMILLIIFLPADIWALMVIALFSIHVAGCVGDMWVAFMLIFRLNSTVLTCDDGPCQRFYEYRPEELTQPETQTAEK